MKLMQETKVFQNGSSQAVRIPKSLRLECSEVYIQAVEGGVLITPKEDRFAAMEASLEQFTPDFMETRHQGELETRASF